VVLLHGLRDRTTDPDGSRALALEARAAGAEAAWLPVPGGDHAMLRHAPTWHSLTARSVAGLLGLGPLPPEVAAALSLPDGT
jgi:acetyl esterase/lipase